MLLLMAGGCDWASVHFYADDVTRFGFSGAQLLQNACAACGAANLSLYVGEFGDDKSKGGGLPVSNAVLQFLSATPCAALARPSTVWVWGELNTPRRSGGSLRCCSHTHTLMFTHTL